MAWVGAFFCVLVDNYKRKATLYTRGGPLRYEEKPRAYKAVFAFMVFLGLFFLFVFLALNIFR
jgi:hypothetical protein